MVCMSFMQTREFFFFFLVIRVIHLFMEYKKLSKITACGPEPFTKLFARAILL